MSPTHTREHLGAANPPLAEVNPEATLRLAKLTLEQGLAPGSARIWRVTDAELLRFAGAVLAGQSADAARMNACLKACDDIPTEILESLPSIIGATVPYRQLQLHRDALMEDLREAATTLRRYEAYHLAKGTQESNEKAFVNAEKAARFEATIAKAEASR